MFTAINLARKLNIDGDTAVRRANKKFEKRFRKMEKLIAQEKFNFENMDLDKLNSFWGRAKVLTN